MKHRTIDIIFFITLVSSLVFLSACVKYRRDTIELDKGQRLNIHIPADPSFTLFVGVLETGEITLYVFQEKKDQTMKQGVMMASITKEKAGFDLFRDGESVLSSDITKNLVTVLTCEQKDKNIILTYTFNQNGEMIPSSRMTARVAKPEKLEIFMNGEFVPAEEKDCKWWIGEKIAKCKDGRWLLVSPEDLEPEQSEEIPEAKFWYRSKVDACLKKRCPLLMLL